MAQQIPLNNNVNQTFRTNLADQQVRITAVLQPVDKSWYLTLADGRGTTLLASSRLGEGGQPTYKRYLPAFNGEIVVQGDGVPDATAWSTDHRLVYLDQITETESTPTNDGYPDAPPSVRVVRNNDIVTLAFTTPNLHGGTLLRYQYRQNGDDWINIDSPDVFDGVNFYNTRANGDLFQVRAITNRGWGAASMVAR